jgi:hypothetical protein
MIVHIIIDNNATSSSSSPVDIIIVDHGIEAYQPIYGVPNITTATSSNNSNSQQNNRTNNASSQSISSIYARLPYAHTARSIDITELPALVAWQSVSESLPLLFNNIRAAYRQRHRLRLRDGVHHDQIKRDMEMMNRDHIHDIIVLPAARCIRVIVDMGPALSRQLLYAASLLTSHE